MQEDELLNKAKKRVNDIKDFYAHLTSFICTIGFLIVVNYMTTPDYWWVLFPAAGWGLAVLGHYISIFGFFGLEGKNWEEKTLQKEMEKLRRKNQVEYSSEPTLDLDDQLELKEKVRQDPDYDDQDLV